MDKNSFRKLCLSHLMKSNRYYYSKIISKEIEKVAKNYKNILLYIPISNEVDIRGVINKLRRKNKTIFVPFMEDLSFKMVKYRLPLSKKRFGILEPKSANKTLSKIDLAIIPLIGIDSSFKRVGFGKGMYDRFFSKLSYKPKIIFIQLRICFSKQVLTDFYDIRADEYISFHIRRKYDDIMVFSRSDIIRSRGLCISKKDRLFKV